MKIEVEQEADGCWIAEIRDLPGALVYGLGFACLSGPARAW